MSRSLTLLVALILCSCNECSDNELLGEWLRNNNLYAINVADMLQQNDILNISQLQSIDKINLHKIWQTATESVFQRLVKQIHNIHNKSQVDAALDHEEQDILPMSPENNAKWQIMKQKAADRKEKLNKFLEDSQLGIFQDVFENNDLYLDELKVVDIDKIINISYMETAASKFDQLRLGVYVTKLQNDVNIDYSDGKHLRMIKQKHIGKDENDMIQNWRDKQLNTNRFINMIADISRNIEYQFAHKMADIDVFITNLAIESKRKKLINELSEWTDEKITQLNRLTHNINLYSTDIQEVLNKSYRNIERDNLNAKERTEILISESKKLKDNYSLFENSSVFAPYINDMSSSIKLRFQDISENTNDFAMVETENIYSIPILKIIDVSQSLFRRKKKQINASIVWEYVYTINNNITDYFTKDVCNQIKIFVDDNKHEAESRRISQNDTSVLCESHVTVDDNDGFGHHEFRIEYELRMRNKMILHDTMNNDKILLLTLLHDYDLGHLNLSHIFSGKQLYLKDVLHSEENTTNLILQNKICASTVDDSKDIFASIDTCLGVRPTTDTYDELNHSLFDQLKLATAFAKWKNGQNIKFNHKQVYEISQLIVLSEKYKRLLNLVPTELSKINDLFSQIFDDIKKFEAEYHQSKKDINAAFDILTARKSILQNTLNQLRMDKFSHIVNLLNHIELRNRFLQTRQNESYTYIIDYGNVHETIYESISNAINQYEIPALFKNALNLAIGSSTHFHVSDLSNHFINTQMNTYGKIEQTQTLIIPKIKLTDIHPLDEFDDLVLNWYYVGEYKENICDSIHIYENDTIILKDINNTVVKTKPYVNKLDSLVKCNSIIKSFGLKENRYKFTIKYDLETPLKCILSDFKEWDYVVYESKSTFFTWMYSNHIILAIILCLLLIFGGYYVGGYYFVVIVLVVIGLVVIILAFGYWFGGYYFVSIIDFWKTYRPHSL